MAAAYNGLMPTRGAWLRQGRVSRGSASRRGWKATCALTALLGSVAPALAQPATGARRSGEQNGAVAAATPRAAVGVDATLTFGPADPAFFNYTDYDENALRLALVSLGASYRLTHWLEAVAELQTANTSRARVSALFVRVTPWRRHPVHLAAGRIPPVFGAFARSRYGSDNPLISAPLAYQYLSTLTPHAVPSSADALLAVRGRGWYVTYPGDTAPPVDDPSEYDPDSGAAPPTAGHRGVALVTSSRWDTGIVARVEGAALTVTGGVTLGSLSDPRVDENNAGKQIVGRLTWRPHPALAVGVSAARGAFTSRAARGVAGPGTGGSPQQAAGVDVDFSRGHVRVRGEVIRSSWRIRTPLSPRLDDPLAAIAATLEARLRVSPRIDLAARGDWIGFSKIAGTLYGGRPTPWDADVARAEAGVSYRLSRHSRVKVAYQHNWRFAATRRTEGFPAVQLAIRF